MVEATQNPETETPEENLSWEDITKMVVLVSLSISKPQLQRTIESADVTIHGEDGTVLSIDPKDRTNPVWTLVPPEWKSKFSRLESRARTLLSRNGVGFAARGCTMVSALAVNRIFSELGELRDEFEAEAQAFSEVFDDLMAARREEMGRERFDILAKNLPTAEEVRNRFGMRWMIIPLERVDVTPHVERLREIAGMATAVESDILEIADRLEQGQTLRDARALAPELQRAQAEFFNQIQHTLVDIAREPQARMLEAVTDLQKKIEDGTRLRSSSLNEIRDAFQYLEDFSFLASSEILERMRECRQILDNEDIREINTGNISRALVSALDDLSRMTANPVDQAEAGRRMRRIRVPD